MNAILQKIEFSFKTIEDNYGEIKKLVLKLKIKDLKRMFENKFFYKYDRLSGNSIDILKSLNCERFESNNNMYIIGQKMDGSGFKDAIRCKSKFFNLPFFLNKIRNDTILNIETCQKIESIRCITRDIISHSNTNFGNQIVRMVTGNELVVQGNNEKQNSHILPNKTQNKDFELRKKVHQHLKDIMNFSRNKRLQLKREHLSESVLMNFGFEAAEHYNYDSIRNRISYNKKHISGVIKPEEHKIYSRKVGDDEFLKHTTYTNNEFIDIYYSSEKIKFFKNIMRGKTTDFFIDGTRQLISIGVDRRQLLAINAVVNNKLYTLVYIIMNAYKSDFYYKIFEIVKKKINIFVYCNSVLIDMEIALIKSLTWLNLDVRICYFHVAYRMIKWKSRNDTNSTNYNYIRPELIRMGQKIIFIPTESLFKYFIIIIFIFVESETDLYRKKYAIMFIEYIYRFYVKVLGNKRYHQVSSKNLTNNFSESLNAKLRRRVNCKKRLWFVIDFCLVNDFEQISIIKNDERKKNKKNEKNERKINVTKKKKIKKRKKNIRKKKIEKRDTTTYDEALKLQKGDQSIGKIYLFISHKIDFEKSEKRMYNLHKMKLTFTSAQISEYKTLFTHSSYRKNFINEKKRQYNLEGFFKTGKYGIETLSTKRNNKIINPTSDLTAIIVSESASYSNNRQNKVDEEMEKLFVEWKENFESDTDAFSEEEDGLDGEWKEEREEVEEEIENQDIFGN